MRTILWPFRLAANGRVVTADDASDEVVNSRLACLIQTRPGERPLEPGFGIPDPVFSRFDANTLAAGVAQFGPPDVEIRAADVAVVDDSQQDITVHWERSRQER